ncbi:MULTISPECIES: GFA family protein [unclassified Aureimonas]|uniref:GFA family protein n=1 Tax=unclassified Aureimonas TaxID=2615206 RepID=UPI000700B39A|nr:MULTISPECIES: GFA family protein [unclassified Aureimonas]KQT60467.1 aldehyde-activating protein [Aureimonas sp. Leaf427]KQT79344.1 aldehyde-activating protein [Aureimonas sp. Leaf460]
MAGGGPGLNRSGGCLCGAVRLDAVLGSAEAGVCHCSMCRKWSGGVFMTVECDSVAFADEASLGIYRSSDYGERLFCRVCGSSLVWRMQDGSAHALALQALDDQSGIALTSEIFIDEKPSFYAFANETRKMTGAEFIAAVTGEGA